MYQMYVERYRHQQTILTSNNERSQDVRAASNDSLCLNRQQGELKQSFAMSLLTNIAFLATLARLTWIAPDIHFAIKIFFISCLTGLAGLAGTRLLLLLKRSF